MGFSEVSTPIIIGVFSVIVSVIFNHRKQKIENDKIFKSLFESFNNRYSKDLNDLFNDLRSNQHKELQQSQVELIIDYLNLCSEEFLWFKKGRIDAEVWNAWKAGIIENINIPQVRDIYLSETKTENQRVSYYGLFDELKIK